MNILLYVIMCMIYGSTFLSIKIGLNAGFEPFFFGFLRFFSAGVILLGILTLKKEKLKYSFKEYRDMALAGFFLVTVCFGAMNYAEQEISSGLAAILNATTPFVIILITFIQKRERIKFEKIIGLLIGLSGIIMIMRGAVTDNYSVKWVFSVALMFVGIFGFAYGSIRAKAVIDSGIKPLVLNVFQMIFGSLGLLLLSVIAGERFYVSTSSNGIFALFYLIFFGSLIAASIYYYLMDKMNSYFPSTWTYVSPIISLFVGALILGEMLSAFKVIQALIVIIGVVISKLDLSNLKKSINTLGVRKIS